MRIECPECGASIDVELEYCEDCGYELVDEEDQWYEEIDEIDKYGEE